MGHKIWAAQNIWASTIRIANRILLIARRVEQRVQLAQSMVDRVYVMVNGHIAYEGGPHELLEDKARQTSGSVTIAQAGRRSACCAG